MSPSNVVNDKLEVLRSFLPENSWRLSFTKKGDCFVKFNCKIDVNTVALVKLMIDDTYWKKYDTLDTFLDEDYYNNVPIFKCYWARNRD